MKRPLIITIGIFIILLVLGLWVYLLAFGAPKETSEVFTNLGVIPESERGTDITDVQSLDTDATVLALTGTELQQLTTRAVAGFTVASSTENILRYVERGTGHVYEINIDESTEKQISLLTIPQTVEAIFSPSGNAVAFTTYEGQKKIVSVGTLPEEGSEMILKKVSLGVENITFKNDNVLYYTRNEDNKTVGYSLNISNLSESELFTTRITDIEVFWGADFNTIYIQTRPTQYLEGYLYSISKNILTPVTNPLYGLTTFIKDTTIITSMVVGDTYSSAWLHDGESIEQGILMLKEKCIFADETNENVWCAAPLEIPNASYVENWYKGVQISKDYLWYTNLATKSSTLVGDLSKLSGKTIDVFDMKIGNDKTTLFFTNKTDQTLWQYRLEQ